MGLPIRPDEETVDRITEGMPSFADLGIKVEQFVPAASPAATAPSVQAPEEVSCPIRVGEQRPHDPIDKVFTGPLIERGVSPHDQRHYYYEK